ncbi:MAG: hypothetical protein IPI14_12415 [Polaromonas sp.]|nr:hypothetical protein [Polaromonas sp.]
MTTYTQSSKRRIILKTSLAAGLLALVPSLVCFAQSDSKTDAAVTTSPSERRGGLNPLLLLMHSSHKILIGKMTVANAVCLCVCICPKPW